MKNKAHMLKYVLAVIEVFLMFALVFCINLSIMFKNSRGFLVSGIEPAIQEAFIPINRDELANLDAKLTTEYTFYKGYTYYDITITCKDKKENSHYMYMASQALNLKLFFPLSEGKAFEFKDNYDILPVIVGGDYYAKSMIGDKLLLFFDVLGENESTVDVMVEIVGKIDDRNFRYPEKVSYDIAADMVNNGFIICPDIYLSEMVNVEEKQVLLNYNNADSAYTIENLNELRVLATKHGVFSFIQNPYNYSLYSFLGNINYALLIIILGLLIVWINMYLIFTVNKSVSILSFGVLKGIGFLLSILSIVCFNFISGVLSAFKVSLLYCLGCSALYLISFSFFYLVYRKRNMIKKTVEAGEKYDKI